MFFTANFTLALLHSLVFSSGFRTIYLLDFMPGPCSQFLGWYLETTMRDQGLAVLSVIVRECL